MPIVKSRFGTQVSGEIVEKQVSDSMRKLFTDKKIKPAMQPKVDFEGKPLDGSDVKFTVNLEIMPDIKIQDFSKLKFDRLIASVEEKDINKALEDIANNQKSYAPLKKKRKSKIGDSVLIDFKGYMDGKLFDGGTAENHRLELGSGQMIPGFEEQLVGFDVNDKKDVKVNFPENYQKADLSGKPATFKVIIKDILEAEKSKINDELATRMGLPDLKSLKEAIKNQIEINYKATARNRIKRDLLDKLSKDYSFDVPKTMLENENKVIWDRFEQDRKAGVIDEIDKAYEWYTSGPRQRLQPGGKIVCVMTRWNVKDLTGILLKNQTEPKSDQWDVVEFPAIMPSGKPVWPEYWKIDELESVKASLSLGKWNAQWMQNPTSEECDLKKMII